LKLIKTEKTGNKTANIYNTSTPTQGGIQNNFSINLPDLLSRGRRLYGLGSSPPAPVHHKKHPSIRSSSPILSDDDTGTEFDRYFEYLTHKFKRDTEKLAAAKTALADQDLDLRGIHETDPSVLVQYGMTYGLALKIKRYIKDFQLEQA
jgi:hypothetical protein